MTWPNLFLIAAPRAGSTQLARWLGTHPDIDLAPIKEPNHFSAHEFPRDYVRASHLNDVDPARYVSAANRPRAQFAVFRDPAQYRSLFAPLAARWRCDASTSYLACPEAPELIHAACGAGTRVVTLTRAPVERALSHYRLAVRTGRTIRPLSAELRVELDEQAPLAARYLLRPSRQAAGVARVRAVFGPERHLPLRFEAMIADPETCLARIAGFLDLDPAGFDLSVEARNRGQAPRFPIVNRRLYSSGLKTWLRRRLPPQFKAALRRVYFRDEPRSEVAPWEHQALARELADET